MATRASVLVLLLSVLSAGIIEASKAPAPEVGEKRAFIFTYEFSIGKLPGQAKEVRLWIPLASTGAYQTVAVEKVESPIPLRPSREREFGNRFLYGETRRPNALSGPFAIHFRVMRREASRGDLASLVACCDGAVPWRVEFERYLEPDRFVPTGGKIKDLADNVTRGKEGPVEKARAIYDYIFRTLRYDKSGAGWGRGDALWVCDSHYGNCTDFHSLFIAMMRAEKIPARFNIGFPVPDHVREGTVPGYHCWAEFYLQGAGWVPVDISEAWKNPSKREYFFGHLDSNRVQFSTGRDLSLAPRQNGLPLNYFIYPYVEVDGRPVEPSNLKFTFREIGQTLRAGE